MDELKINAQRGQELTLRESNVRNNDNTPSAFIGVGEHEYGGHHSYEGMKKIHEWAGAWLEEHPAPPELVEGWQNIYESGLPGAFWDTHNEAIDGRVAGRKCVACIKVSYHIGDGLEPEGS